MFKSNDNIYFVDLFDGKIKGGKFIDYDQDGLWLRLVEAPYNKYVYKEDEPKLVFKDAADAEKILADIHAETKARLLEENRFIQDAVQKLTEHFGSFYAGIIKEILLEKAGPV